MRHLGVSFFTLILWSVFHGTLAAQEQPLVTDEPPDAPVGNAIDPLRDVSRPELQELAKQPLPPAEGKTETAWRETLLRAFEIIDQIPLGTVERAAFKYRRARVRLTEEERAAGKQPFRLLSDFEKHPDRYLGRTVALHGYLIKIRPMGDTPGWQEGWLKLWNEKDEVVRFVTRAMPKDFPKGEKLHEPITVIGYVFATEPKPDAPASPLIVTSGIRWMKPELDRGTLINLKDRTLGIREEESDALYRTLLHATLVDEATQKQLAEEFWENRKKELPRPRPLFVDLFKTTVDDKSPETYRGQVITLTGNLRRLYKFPADPLNGYGLDTLYEAWIYNEDAQSNPTVVFFVENPDELPEGSELSIPVEVTGYVFKMYGYPAQDNKLRVAPMLLAKSMKKRIIPETEPFPVIWLGTGISVLLLGIVLFLWVSHRKDGIARQQKIALDQEQDPPQFDNLPLE